MLDFSLISFYAAEWEAGARNSGIGAALYLKVEIYSSHDSGLAVDGLLHSRSLVFNFDTLREKLPGARIV